MLAGEIFAEGQIRLIDLPEPSLQDSDGADQILFEIQLACLCGSDLPFFSRDDPDGEYHPVVGHSLHEMMGTVLQTNGQRFRPGDQVLCIPDRQMGLFERYCVGEDRAVSLRSDLSPEQAVLSQPLGTVICALKKVPNLIDTDVAVVGQGPIGQLMCAALRNMGSRRVIAIDLLAARLETSLRMGANVIIDAQRDDPVAQVRQMTGGRMADLVIHVTGHNEPAMGLCTDICREGGKILFFSLPMASVDNAVWRLLFRKNIQVLTSVGPDFERDFPLAMQWIGEGRIDVAPIITHRYGLADIQKAFETFRDRREGALKVMVEFPSFPIK